MMAGGRDGGAMAACGHLGISTFHSPAKLLTCKVLFPPHRFNHPDELLCNTLMSNQSPTELAGRGYVKKQLVVNLKRRRHFRLVLLALELKVDPPSRLFRRINKEIF